MAIFFATALLAIGVAVPTSPASAQTQEGDGLVVVQIGNIKDVVDINAAANVVAQACGVSVEAVIGVISDIDSGDRNKATFCRTETGKVSVKQNH
jgi:hypothetical protein